jgi:hypothetical protein
MVTGNTAPLPAAPNKGDAWLVGIPPGNLIRRIGALGNVPPHLETQTSDLYYTRPVVLLERVSHEVAEALKAHLKPEGLRGAVQPAE